MVFEVCDLVGGVVVIEEFYFGFCNLVVSYMVFFLNLKVINDFELVCYGFWVVECRIGNFFFLEDGYLFVGDGLIKVEMVKFLQCDVDCLDEFNNCFEVIVDVLCDFVFEILFNLFEGGLFRVLLEMFCVFDVGGKFNMFDLIVKCDLLDLFFKLVGDWLDGWFESVFIKVLLGFDGVVGNYVSFYM